MTARVWAVVLTHGGAEEITADCITSLQAQDYESLVVLLVDNASFDGSGTRLRERFPGIEYLNTGGNYGYTGGNNRGMAYALERGAEYLLVLNNDTILEPACVSTLMRSVSEADRAGAIAPKMLYFDDPSRIWFAGGDLSRMRIMGLHRRELEPDDPLELPRLERMTFATGCCFLIPAAVARSVGLFAEDFFIYGEDVDLSLRLAQAGYALYYQPAARLYHREPAGPADPSAFQIRMRDRNRRRIARRSLGVLERARFAIWFYPTRAIHWSRYVLRGDWERARAIIGGVTER